MRSGYSALWRGMMVGWVVFSLAYASGCSRRGIHAPVGHASGVIQFDATIEIDPPLSPNSIALFARYWVCSNYYRVAVVWGEPDGERMWFSIYPPTLRLASDSETFSTVDDLFPNHDAVYERPVGDRGVFSNMFGDYPVQNLRFADGKAYADRPQMSDLGNVLERATTGADGTNWFMPANPKLTGRIAKIGVFRTNNEIKSLQLEGKDGRLLAESDYEYDPADQVLSKELVRWPEERTTTGFADGAIHIKVGGTNFDYNRFEATYEPGGRAAEVDYGLISAGGGGMRLPVRITVRAAESGEILRSARMSNFQVVGMDRAAVDRAASRYAGFSPLEMQYRLYSRKYWSSSPASLPPDDASAIKKARDEIEAELPASRSKSVGEQLKCVHMALDLNRILGEKARFAKCYDTYLSVLATNGLTNMVFEAGYIAVRAAAGWDRYEDASGLLTRWISVLTGFVGGQEVIRLAARDMATGNLWPNFLLLEQLQAEDSRSAAMRFERASLQSVILGRLIDQATGKNRVKRQQHSILASVPPLDGLLKMFDERAGLASACFTNIQQATDSEKALKGRLDELEERRKDWSEAPTP